MPIPQRHRLEREVLRTYLRHADRPIQNAELYEEVARRQGLPSDALTTKQPIGKSGQHHNPMQRAIRWSQQTLKSWGILEHVSDQRGIWALTDPIHRELHRAKKNICLLAFSTDLGLAIWGSHEDLFPHIHEPITLCVTSPPYPLRKPRAYGNPSLTDYVDFICLSLESIIRNLVPGGSICLNLSNDIFVPGSPARSLYREQLLIALCGRYGLHKMDELIWVNPTKPPGPTEWACKRGIHLQTSYEVIYWLSNDPSKVKADNRRVLTTHTARHKAFVAQGGERHYRSSNDGAHVIRPGSFSQPTAGRLPRNVLTISHTCADSRQYRQDATRLGLPLHGAVQPLAIPRFLIEFLSEPGDLIVDPFGGSLSSAIASEQLKRSWIVCEWIYEYIRGGAERFCHYPGFHLHPAFS